MPASGELVEELAVQALVGLSGSQLEEGVAADKLVHHLAVAGETREDDRLLLELNHHVTHLPVDVPGLQEGAALCQRRRGHGVTGSRDHEVTGSRGHSVTSL